jgi:hypothetical protein
MPALVPTGSSSCQFATVADTGVLDEKVGFLEACPVKPEEETYYDLPSHAEGSASLYQRCVRAIEHGIRFGAHGLPLMGCGDWNDGMNRVGDESRSDCLQVDVLGGSGCRSLHANPSRPGPQDRWHRLAASGRPIQPRDPGSSVGGQ